MISTEYFLNALLLVDSMAGLTRLELATFRVTGGCSNQLSYNPVIWNRMNSERLGSWPAHRSFGEGGSYNPVY